MSSSASSGERPATDPSDRDIVIYGKAGCCLCDDAKPLVGALAAEYGLQMKAANILDDAQLTAAYRFRIPVVTFRGVVLDEGRVTASAVRTALQRVLAQARPVHRHRHDPGR
jgi:predicted nucleotidyltransferase